MTWPLWTSMVAPWQWALLAVVPPAIIALYFLKLRREPLEVPSTFLWHKSIDDMHVNSIWQKLRRSLLLLLQLLLLALLALALLRPSWQGSSFVHGRVIFLIDNSASMSATDVEPTRLDEAKERALALIEKMGSGDVAMVVSFSDGARVEQMFTDNRGELRRRVNMIQPTDKGTSITEALRVASVLANPGRSATDITDERVAEALPAQLFFFSDGNFVDDPDFSLGNLDPTPPVWIGNPAANNVAIVAFGTARSETDAAKLQAFGRLVNSGAAVAAIDVELLLEGNVIDAEHLAIPATKSAGVKFDLEHFNGGALELRIVQADDLAVDNRAWTVVHAPRRSKVLVATPGDEPLTVSLRTQRAVEMADITLKSPDFLATPQYRQPASAGAWDLVIYDRCRPEEMPQANTLFIGQLPPGDQWHEREQVVAPPIIDTHRAHPLMQWLDLSDVVVLQAKPLTMPQGGTVLVDGSDGPLVGLAPRGGFEDVVMAFELVGTDTIGTNWPVRPSFPVFMLNLLSYLGGNSALQGTGTVEPGHVVALRPETDATHLSIVPPEAGAAAVDVVRDKHNLFHFAGTNRVGVYEVKAGAKEVDEFAVNLFNERESDIKVDPDRVLKIGNYEVGSTANWEASRRDGWKILLLVALAVLVFEWYIYNRRAYL